MKLAKLGALAAILALPAACGEPAEGPGGVTAEESRRLNEAVEMLEADSLVPEDPELGNGEWMDESGAPVLPEEQANQS